MKKTYKTSNKTKDPVVSALNDHIPGFYDEWGFWWDTSEEKLPTKKATNDYSETINTNRRGWAALDLQNQDDFLDSGIAESALYSCACKPQPLTIRVISSDFQARCMICGQRFYKVS